MVEIFELFKNSPNRMVLDWFKRVPESAIFLSVLTIGEIRKGIENHPDNKRKEEIRIWLESDLPNKFEDRILVINQDVAERWGRLLNEVDRPMPAIDSLLAATALHYDMRFVTRNVLDFNYPSLEVVNPWE